MSSAPVVWFDLMLTKRAAALVYLAVECDRNLAPLRHQRVAVVVRLFGSQELLA